MDWNLLIGLLVVFAVFLVLLVVLTWFRRRAGGGLGSTDHYDGSTTVTPTGYKAEPDTDISDVTEGDTGDDQVRESSESDSDLR